MVRKLRLLPVDETKGDRNMGKYVLAWLLGVPGILLVLIYIFFN